MCVWRSSLRESLEVSVKHSCQEGVCHTVAFAIYIKKYLKAKEELSNLK
jgi:succinate dehydrogenase/fumarate reductase-like Fe-S protein